MSFYSLGQCFELTFAYSTKSKEQKCPGLSPICAQLLWILVWISLRSSTINQLGLSPQPGKVSGSLLKCSSSQVPGEGSADVS